MTTAKPAEDSYQVFNRRQSIGVSATRTGAINGIYLSEKVRKTNERDLAKEILAVAAVASMRGRLGAREEIERAAAENGTTVHPSTYEVLPKKLPTAQEYESFKQQVLKY